MKASSKYWNNRSRLKRKTPQLLPALVAVGGICGLTAYPADALELGDVQVNSALGQPLRASIAYALNPNEQVHSYCIYLRPGGSTNSAPPIDNAKVSLTGNQILITTRSAIREPLLGMQIAVDCAYTPNLVREYTIMVNPEVPMPVARSVTARNGADQSRTQSQSRDGAEAGRINEQPAGNTPRQTTAMPDIVQNTKYRVQPGDTISTIVSRIRNRSVGLWSAVEIIVAANPDAFVDQDMNRLIAGSEIIIPTLVGAAVANEQLPDNAPEIAVSERESVTEMIGDIVETAPTAIVEDKPDAAPVTSQAIAENEKPAISLPDDSAGEDSMPRSTTASELRPGDVIVVPQASAGIERSSPDVTAGSAAPTINSNPPNNTGVSGAWTWLLWLGGSGIALFIGLLLFGRAIRKRFGSSGGQAAEVPLRRKDDDATREAQIISDVDFEFEDTINATAISLDADLDVGSGLNAAADVDLAQDFGFSSTGNVESQLDLEITEAAARDPEPTPTDIIPPNHREEPVTIIESEELPSHDDEEYDLSMIVDATKQPIGDYDATAKDLQAVRVDSSPAEEEYTMSSAVDYQALEQDYQDEFTATQAANAEMERVALELSRRIDEVDDHVTAELRATELTVEMPARDAREEPLVAPLPGVSDPDVTAELTANLPTTMEAENDSVADHNDPEVTVEMSAAGSDITVDLPLETARGQGRKKRK